MKKLLTLFTLITLTTSASAMFCPSNFNQINIGDTIDQVRAQCGKADNEKEIKPVDNGPQEWNFYVNPQMKAYTGLRTPNAQQNASVKMSIALNEGRVVNITINGMSLAATTICGPGVAVGDTATSVKNACGDPVFINKSSANDNGEKPDKIIELQYNTSPPVTLTFKNGLLQSRS